MNFNLMQTVKSFGADARGLAFIESALILPLMLVVLFGLFDLGQAMIINQKVTAAAHIASDLITRKPTITQTDLNNAVGGAQLVIDPYSRNPLGIDIVGIEFNEENNPVEIWRHTDNMTASNSLVSDADGLGLEGEGVVAVRTVYTYTPVFAGNLFGTFDMEETAYLRGRRTSVVRYNEEGE